jgi:hypothetical protein
MSGGRNSKSSTEWWKEKGELKIFFELAPRKRFE